MKASRERAHQPSRPGAMLSGRRFLPDAGLAFLLIGVAALLLYAGSFGNPLVFDSAAWFRQDNLRALGDLATTDRYVSKTVTYWLYRLLDGRLELLRAVHLAIHVAAAFVAFVLFRRLMEQFLPGRHFGPALALALLFAIHPLQVYAVADLGQMELVLATLFGLVMLLAYMEALLRDSRVLFGLSVLSYLLAVFSKENVIALPAVALALTLLVRRPSGALARRLWPWYALFGLIAIWIVIGEVGQPRPFREMAVPPSFDHDHLHLRSAITQGYFFFRYLLLWLFPYPGWMSIDVQLPLAHGVLSWPETVGFVGFCLYPVAAAWLLMRGGRTGLVGFGLLWPWLLFLPELAAPRITEAFVLYRSYPWIAGLLAALVLGLAPLLGRAGVPLLCLACLGLGALTHERLGTFRSDHAVWDDAVRKNRPYERRAAGAYRAYLNRGEVRLRLGRVDAALADFDASLALYPGLPLAHLNRGLAYIKLSRHREALAAFDEGLASSAGLPPGVRARAHSNRAGLYLMMGRSRDALGDLVRAAALEPDREEYRVNMERLRAELGSR